jgi:hypothetical protein
MRGGVKKGAKLSDFFFFSTQFDPIRVHKRALLQLFDEQPHRVLFAVLEGRIGFDRLGLASLSKKRANSSEPSSKTTHAFTKFSNSISRWKLEELLGLCDRQRLVGRLCAITNFSPHGFCQF